MHIKTTTQHHYTSRMVKITKSKKKKLQSLTRPNIGEVMEQPDQSFMGVETETCLVASTKAELSDPAVTIGNSTAHPNKLHLCQKIEVISPKWKK